MTGRSGIGPADAEASAAGQPAATAGQPAATAGQPAATTGQPATAAQPAQPAAAGQSSRAIIEQVDTGSPAQRAGLQPGMAIVAVDGQPLEDIIDWLWLTDGNEVELLVEDAPAAPAAAAAPLPATPAPTSDAAPPTPPAPAAPPTPLTLRRKLGQPWGLTFASPLFNGLKTCCNTCEFCFLTMLPPGLRPSLYLRDDDYRLSFLQGNFVTLTNLSPQHLNRIITHRLSPLHVSLHATNPALRRRLIGPHHARGLTALDRLLAAGIQIHAQIVLIPNLNSGPQLTQTLSWIAQRPGIISTGIVPYGFTSRASLTSTFTLQNIRELIVQVAPFQRQSLEKTGRLGFQLADAWYVQAKLPIPAATYYDDFPQYENGIGMVRSFIDNWESTQEVSEVSGGRYCFDTRGVSKQYRPPDTSYRPPDTSSDTSRPPDALALPLRQQLAACGSSVLVTGEAFAPTLRELVKGYNTEVLAVRNSFFGGNVDVAGLLTAQDIIGQVEERQLAKDTVIIVPQIIFNDDGLTLDDKRLEHIAQALGRQVRVAC